MKKLHPFYLIGLILFAFTSTACGVIDRTATHLEELRITEEDLRERAAQAREAAEAAIQLAQNGSTILESLQDAHIQLPQVDTQAIAAKVATIQPDANGIVTVTITADELNQAFQDQALTVENQVSVSGAAIQFEQNAAHLSGQLTQPIAGTLNISFTPYLVNNAVQFDVTTASFNDFPVPDVLITQAETMLNGTVSQAMSQLPANVIFHSIIITNGAITISGQQI